MTRDEIENFLVNATVAFPEPAMVAATVNSVSSALNALDPDICLMVRAQLVLGSIGGMLHSGLGDYPDINDLTPDLEPRLRATLEVIEASAKLLREFLDTHTGKGAVQ